jgi:hypothetical protein
MKRRPSSAFRLSLERLESRQLMAGEVLIEVVDHQLHITGDALDNNIAIEWLGGDSYQIRSTFSNNCLANEPPTMIRVGNSVAESQTVSGVTDDIEINMRGGADVIRLRGTLTTAFWAPQDLTIDTGTGDDYVGLYKVNMGDDLEVDLGDGNDDFSARLFYVGTRAGDHDLVVRGGNGLDWVGLYYGTVRDEVRLEMGYDNQWDGVEIDDLVVFNDITILTGAGDDEVEVRDLQVSDDLTIDAGDGADQVSLDQTAADELFARLGTGNDELSIRDSHVRRADLNGGGGSSDDFSFTHFVTDESLNFYNFEFGYMW